MQRASRFSRIASVRGRAAVVLLAAVLGLGACRGREAPPAAPVAVLVMAVRPSPPDGDTVRYPVEVAARYSNVLSFRVGGKLIERRVRLGDVVRKGEVLARLDPIDAQRQAAAARASLDAAEHRLLFARQQLDRDTAQSAQNLISANQLEQTQDGYSSAAAAREQAADQFAVARNALAYDSLVADHDGVITSENADTGQVVTSGQAVFGLDWTGDTDVVLDAAASDIQRIAPGQLATVTIPALRGRRFDARVREVAPAADPQSRTFRVKLTLTAAGAEIRPGMTGDATLSVTPRGSGRAPAFKIPATAIFHRGSEPAVWVVRGTQSLLELRAVSVDSYEERSVIVSGGLEDGDTVLIAGAHTVYEGERVRPVLPLFSGEDQAAAITDGETAGAESIAPVAPSAQAAR